MGNIDAKSDGLLEKIQSYNNSTFYTAYKYEKLKNDNKQRMAIARSLEKENLERGIARSANEAYEEKIRRMKYELEGLIIERPKPEKDEFPGKFFFIVDFIYRSTRRSG